MFTATGRVIKFALQNFWRNFWLSLVTVSMLALTLLSVNILLVLNRVTDSAIQAVENRIEVSVYFNPTVTTDQLTSAAGELRALPQVRDVETITADDALAQFKARHASDDAILQSLTEVGGNPFGPSLVIKAGSADDFPAILTALQDPRFQDEIREKDFSDYTDVINRIRSLTDRARTIGFAIATLFLIIAALIVFNTVRISTFVHREEIGIMKLVGATDRFVKAPFLVEAILYSLLATAIVAGIMLPAVAALEPTLNQFLGSGNSVGLVTFFQQDGLLIFGGEFVALSLLNMLATSLAMRRYLRV